MLAPLPPFSSFRFLMPKIDLLLVYSPLLPVIDRCRPSPPVLAKDPYLPISQSHSPVAVFRITPLSSACVKMSLDVARLRSRSIVPLLFVRFPPGAFESRIHWPLFPGSGPHFSVNWPEVTPPPLRLRSVRAERYLPAPVPFPTRRKSSYAALY